MPQLPVKEPSDAQLLAQRSYPVLRIGDVHVGLPFPAPEAAPPAEGAHTRAQAPIRHPALSTTRPDVTWLGPQPRDAGANARDLQQSLPDTKAAFPQNILPPLLTSSSTRGAAASTVQASKALWLT